MEVVVNQLSKTKLCNRFARGVCFKDDCPFAHSKDELRARPDLSMTKMCKQRKACTNRSCTFAHSEDELRTTNNVYKTQLCNFYQRGFCKKGSACRHAHGEDDLRGATKKDTPGASGDKTPLLLTPRVSFAGSNQTSPSSQEQGGLLPAGTSSNEGTPPPPWMPLGLARPKRDDPLTRTAASVQDISRVAVPPAVVSNQQFRQDLWATSCQGCVPLPQSEEAGAFVPPPPLSLPTAPAATPVLPTSTALTMDRQFGDPLQVAASFAEMANHHLAMAKASQAAAERLAAVARHGDGLGSNMRTLGLFCPLPPPGLPEPSQPLRPDAATLIF